jgi:hypothetical protein
VNFTVDKLVGNDRIYHQDKRKIFSLINNATPRICVEKLAALLPDIYQNCEISKSIHSVDVNHNNILDLSDTKIFLTPKS